MIWDIVLSVLICIVIISSIYLCFSYREHYRPESPLVLAPLGIHAPPYSPYGIRLTKIAGEPCDVSDECASLACGPQDQDQKQCLL
jgi:hypothetical protein